MTNVPLRGNQRKREILTDLGNVCQGKNPKRMKVLEIGCGTGRITRALARYFGQVYAVDMSAEMVAQARLALRDSRNAHVFQNNGRDLTVVRRHGLPRLLERMGIGKLRFDFAFSYIVFQHIPSREVIESYVREVHRLLRPGALFKNFRCRDARACPMGQRLAGRPIHSGRGAGDRRALRL